MHLMSALDTNTKGATNFALPRLSPLILLQKRRVYVPPCNIITMIITTGNARWVLQFALANWGSRVQHTTRNAAISVIIHITREHLDRHKYQE